MNASKFGKMLRGLISSIAASENLRVDAVDTQFGEQVEPKLSASAIRYYKTGNIPPDYKAVAVFARIAVTRDARSRLWVEQFLRAADYPAPERLLADLFSDEHERRPTRRPARRLPVPPFSEFIPRVEAVADVVEGLQMGV